MATSRTFLSRGLQLIGKSGRTYELQMPCVSRNDGIPSSTWSACETTDRARRYIIKQPWDMASYNVTLLRREQAFHEKLKDKWIFRRLQDTVPEVMSKEGSSMVEPPRLVLEPMEKTVWQARWERRFTRREIKFIMKMTLYALSKVEQVGMVNTGICSSYAIKLSRLNLSRRPGDGEHHARQSPCGAGQPS